VDGGHIPIHELNAALKYPLLSIALKVSRSLTNITEKSSTNPVCSQPKMTSSETMKSYVLNAAHQQGMNQDSCHRLAADGAKNCWSVIASLKPHCQRLESTLIGFISARSSTVKQALGDSFEDSLKAVNGTCGMAMLRRALPN